MPYENSIATSFLDQDDEDIAITNLLNKYELSVDSSSSYLYSLRDDYNTLIDYISELYIEKQAIPEDIIEELDNNKNFRNFLLSAIQKKMRNILYDRKTIIFKEIVTIVNLLSFGQNFQIFESYNSYNIDNLSKLFRVYEDKLQKNHIDKKEFELLFEYYVILIEVLNELCTINAVDIQRKKTINKILEAISESINITKFSIVLDEHKVNRLNNLLGKFLFYFTHIPYVNIENKDANYLIEEFSFNFQKITDGYELSKNTKFGEDENPEKYYKKYLDSVTTLLSTLIYKLETNYDRDEYENIKMFKNIIEHYEEAITHAKVPTFETIDELKNELLQNYLYIHGDALENQPVCILDEYLQTDKFDYSNIHIIYSIVLFSNDLEEKKLVEILTKLLTSEKFKNDYLEFYKLDICDVIINKLIKLNSSVIKESLNELIINYIEQNKIASHLIAIYSKIYLSLSLYFSYSKEIADNEKAKKYYYVYKKINGDELLNNEYRDINQIILKNFGTFLIDDLNIKSEITKDHYLEIGNKTINKFLEKEEINQKYNINQTLSNIVTKIFTDDGLDDDTLNDYIEEFISLNIFHGLIFCKVDGLCENKCRLIDIGYEKMEIPLLEGYTLKMAYSTVYKDTFEYIFNRNEDYIKQNVINIIISYLKSIPLYKDKFTLLYNVDKLQKDLKTLNDDEFIFIEFYLNSLEELNLKHGYAKTNKMFKEFAQTVDKLAPTYRMSGPKLGIILPKEVDYKELIESIKKIEVTIENKPVNMEYTFAISWGNRDNILLKSAHSVIMALRESSKYYEFK